MNQKEKEASDSLLKKLAAAEGVDALNLANAYQALMQGMLNRTNAEVET